MSSQQQSKQQIKLNQLNSILSTNNNNNSTNNNNSNSNEVETTISKEVNLWQIRELAIADGGLLNGTYVLNYIIFVFMLLFRGSFWYLLCIYIVFLLGVFVCVCVLVYDSC